MSSRRLSTAIALFVIAAALVSGGSVGAAPAQTSNVGGSPDLDVYVSNPNLVPGQTNQVELTIANDGNLRFGDPAAAETAMTARNVRVDAEARGPFSVESGETAIGGVTTTAPRSVPVSINVPDSVDSGTYTLDLDLTYAYISSGEDRTVTVSRQVELRVREDARFQVVGVESDTQVGDSGTVEATIENVGAETARNALVSFSSQTRSVTINGGETASVRVDELEPGQTTTVAYDVGVASDLPIQQYMLAGQVRFEDPDGITRADEGLSLGILPLAEQEFALTNMESQLRVGEDGDLIGTVRNDGPVPAQSVVVRYADEARTLTPIEESAAVGSLESGESADFRLPIGVSSDSEAGPKSIDFAVRYRNQEGDRRMYEELDVYADVAPERDQFDIGIDDSTIAAGSSRTLSIRLTNNLDEPVTDIEPKLFTDGPLSSSDDTTFVPELAPGETATIRFEMSAEGGATAKTHSATIDVRYDDADGDSKLSDTQRVAVSVVEPAEGTNPLLVGGIVALLVVLTVGVYRWKLQ